MKRNIYKLYIYRHLINILNKRKKSPGETTHRIIDRMYSIFSKPEPDFELLFEKIKSQVEKKSKLREDFIYLKTRNLARRRMVIGLTAVAAIALLLLLFDFSSQIIAYLKGYDGNANPEIVAKISQVYDRSRALLIINDTTTIELSKDTAIFGISDNFRNPSEQEEQIQSKIITNEDEPVQMNMLVIPKGSEFLVTLPDGSEVFLNSNAKLTFPSRFEGDKREVHLEGEGMFTVKKTGTPFQVVSGNSVTTVLGTVFNIKNNENIDEVTLCSGSVEVTNSTGSESHILVPEQQASVSDIRVDIEKVNLKEIIAWTEGKYYFRNIPFEEITEKLHDWYDVEFQFENDIVKNVPFTGMINRNSKLETIFELFEMSYNLNFTVSDSCIKINYQNNF
nr:FecR domain-containing protein [uncultured Draconibacterium sp.]